jgi:hypothetical protein
MCECLQNFLLLFTAGSLQIMGHETYLTKICVIAPPRLKKGQQIFPEDFSTFGKRNGTVV